MKYLNEFMLTAVKKNANVQSKIEIEFEYKRKNGKSALYTLKYKHKQKDMYLQIDTGKCTGDISKYVLLSIKKQMYEYELLEDTVMMQESEHMEFIKKTIKAKNTETLLKDKYYNYNNMLDISDNIYKKIVVENNEMTFPEILEYCLKKYTKEYMIEKYHEEERRKEMERAMVLDKPSYSQYCSF